MKFILYNRINLKITESNQQYMNKLNTEYKKESKLSLDKCLIIVYE